MSRDWSLSDAEIARQEGCHPSTITRHRRQAGITPTNPRDPVDWSKVKDWSLTNGAIAEYLGCSVGGVDAARKRFKIKPARKQGGRECFWRDIDWTKHNKVIAFEKGKSLSAVIVARFRYGNGVRAATRKPGKRQQATIDLKENDQAHRWLDRQGVPREDGGKRLTLLQRFTRKVPFSLQASEPLPEHIQKIRQEPYP